ncbi:flavin reductase family protein [Nonomuraea endophytica]|uniref:3-hydroxy-9,10-secoandrosta-1,3,5(10)-triene-9, 17-dione monooxygenase reductase component n=1 Tax=Nonomuraea endophytica TaxID=714136 RepID=A0A7W8A583_9ACTN|nr:flavin reductase family protein [Nonomuraea endophytica]MBB5078951.1 3-hydroxy-9,10-secoandrosta-1,3,5(10)-triene-9,17-dione monooxygenase reductase component [Nonomuraea endophytica]
MSLTDDAAAVPAQLFKTLAGSLPTGVTVVTSLAGTGRPAGLTSGAVCALSADPPLMLVCIGRGSRTLTAIESSGAFCVNVLDAGSASLSERFAGGGDGKFDGIAWRPGRHGVPVLTQGTVAHAICEVLETVSGGDHLIVIGLVVEGAREREAAPLLYHRRRYAGFPAQRA